MDRPVPSGSHADPYYSNTTDITGAEDQPDLVVRVGTVSHHHPEGKPLAYSMDGGKSWLEPVSLPQEKAQNGHVAVSSDGRTWIWTPDRMPVYYTNDRGVTWSTAEGIPENLRVIADRVNPKRFYALDLSAAVLYESMDGGVSFQSRRLPFAPFDSKARNARGDRREDRTVCMLRRERKATYGLPLLTAYIMVFPEKHSYPWIRCVASTLSVLEKPRPVRIIRRYIWQGS